MHWLSVCFSLLFGCRENWKYEKMKFVTRLANSINLLVIIITIFLWDFRIFCVFSIRRTSVPYVKLCFLQQQFFYLMKKLRNFSVVPSIFLYHLLSLCWTTFVFWICLRFLHPLSFWLFRWLPGECGNEKEFIGKKVVNFMLSFVIAALMIANPTYPNCGLSELVSSTQQS